MILAMISYISGEHYHFVAKDWEDLKVVLEHSEYVWKLPELEEKKDELFLYAEDGGTWLSAQIADQLNTEKILNYK